MTKSPIKLRLLHCAEDNSYTLLYTDGTMSTFSKDEPHSRILRDLMADYQSANILTADGQRVGRWKDLNSDKKLDEVTSLDDGKKYEIAAQVAVCDPSDETAGFRLEIDSPEVITLWLQKDPISLTEDGTAEYTEARLLYLEEYYEEINAGRADDEKVSMNAIRTKVARGQIPKAVKENARWKIPSGTPWPADKRYKSK